ncbi:esterase-like activity of phytase family protein [Methylosinus sp. Ce-a6]|uniref:esterase-like activity of phytase family protein n=1 Tax=Methylosinus sp. Ce-a6 TaxID=2172005 RepID=UPI0013580779|nr:esterase-like activity of phytase family protein [Methylosinus sp. Ce-a6]
MSFRTLLLASISTLALHGAATAQSYRTPNVVANDDPSSISLGGVSFTNQGLVGTGRLPAATIDFLGDTLGSFSSLAIDPYSWRQVGSSFVATMFALPDRGLNDPANGVFSDYAGRLLRFNIAFSPYSGPNLSASTGSQNQVRMTPDGGLLLRDDQGKTFTGADAGSGAANLFGRPAPSPAAGSVGAGKISLDAEGLAFKTDRSFYVSDEYGPSIFYFDANGNLVGSIGIPSALLPRNNGAIDFNSTSAPQTGRRNNQGLEAVSVSPDGARLFAILQSATIQDQASGQQTRNNTRILVYDISTNPTPAAPVESYVLQLPTLTQNGKGGSPNRTAAQSETVALNDRQLLVLARDGTGQGSSPGNPIVVKSIFLVDIGGATNIAGTAADTTPGGQVAPSGVLNPAITPAQSVELVNILNTTQLARFGLTLANGAPGQPAQSQLTLAEKWEGMALVPTLVEGRPNDFYLFVSNDNDFVTTNGVMQGQSYNAGENNDNMVLVYRLTLPTAVDPLFLKSMRDTAPVTLARIDAGALGLASSAAAPVVAQLHSIRRAQSGVFAAQGLSAWLGGNVDFGPTATRPGLDGDRTLYGGSFGLDYGWKELRAGVAATVRAGQYGGGALGYFDISPTVSPSLYAGYFGDLFYLHGTATFSPDVGFSDIRRLAAYGLTGVGRTSVDSYAFGGEIGAKLNLDAFQFTPFFGVTQTHATIRGYTESGAAGGNVVYPEHSILATTLRYGVEASASLLGVNPWVRAAYNQALDRDPKRVQVSLAGVLSPMATQSILIPTYDRNSVTVGVGAQGDFAPNIGWRIGYDADIATRYGNVAHSVTTALRVGF